MTRLRAFIHRTVQSHPIGPVLVDWAIACGWVAALIGIIFIVWKGFICGA